MSTNCGHDHCGSCCGGSCTGCGALELTPDELALLRRFAQLPFLPIAQRACKANQATRVLARSVMGQPVCVTHGVHQVTPPLPLLTGKLLTRVLDAHNGMHRLVAAVHHAGAGEPQCHNPPQLVALRLLKLPSVHARRVLGVALD